MSKTRVGEHYQGREGDAYFAWQREIGAIGAQLNRQKFAPHVRSGDVVVDFGCGTGELLTSLDARVKIGIEANPAARAAAERVGIRTLGSADELEPGTVDLVISNHALEHVLEPLTELRALRRSLRDGGRLVLWLPVDDWRAERGRRLDRNHHLYTWTPLLITNLLQTAGYVVEDARVVAHAWPKGYVRLHRILPARVFAALAAATAVLLRRRQLAVVARKED